MINVAFEGLPISFICPYDARILPDEVIGHAVEIPAGSPSTELSFGAADMPAVRRVVE